MFSCAHVSTPIPDGLAVAAALQAAEARCVAAGERWTPSRHRTYEMLLEAAAPVKAYDLVAAFGRQGEPLAKPPTIYRALEFLIVHSLAHRIESLNAFVACRGNHGIAGAEFLICECCGGVQERALGAGPVAIGAAGAQGFQPRRVMIEVHGACAECRCSEIP